MNNTFAMMLRDPEVAAKLAKKVECSIHHLRNIRDGRRTPSLRLAKRLSEATKLSMDAFLQESK